MSNYPDNWSWSDYDDYHDPKLVCGHHSSDGCDCWCPHYAGYEGQHLVDECDSKNCSLFMCKDCDGEVENDTEERVICKECIIERGCVCTDLERRVRIDCIMGPTERICNYAVKVSDVRNHWTLSPFSRDEQRAKKVVVTNIKCLECYLEVDP